MSTVYVPPQAQPRIEPSQFMQSNLVVTPYVQNALAAGANQVLLQRTKELFSSAGPVGTPGIIPNSSATRVRWRFAGHTSPYESYLFFYVLVARPTAAGAAAARLEVFNSAGSSSLGLVDINYGGIASADTPNEFQEFIGTLTIAANTEITGVISDVGQGRLIQAMVCEQALLPDTANGYFPTSTGNGASIISTQRSDIASAMTSMWKNGAAAIASFTGDAVVVSSLTDTNVVDQSSTTVTTATPGLTLDLRYKNRLSKSIVPVRMRVYGSCTTASKGRVRLKDSSGTTMLEVSGFGTSDSWLQIDGTLPATLAKYDLLAAMTSGGTGGTKATLNLSSPPEGNGSAMVLQARTAGTAGNAYTFTVASGGSPGTLSISNVSNATTLKIREASDFSHGSIEPLINASATLIQVLTTDPVDTAWNQFNGSLGGPWSFSGGTDDTVTIKAISIFELET